jgi:hypothetical protein
MISFRDLFSRGGSGDGERSAVAQAAIAALEERLAPFLAAANTALAERGRRVLLHHLGDAPDNRVEVVVESLTPGASGRGERETVSWQALPEQAADVTETDAQAVIRDVPGLSGEHGWLTQAARAALERDWLGAQIREGRPDEPETEPGPAA